MVKLLTKIFYINTVETLRKSFKTVRPDRYFAEILLQHENARPNPSKTREAINKSRVGCYSPSTVQSRSCFLRFPLLRNPLSWHPLCSRAGWQVSINAVKTQCLYCYEVSVFDCTYRYLWSCQYKGDVSSERTGWVRIQGLPSPDEEQNDFYYSAW